MSGKCVSGGGRRCFRLRNFFSLQGYFGLIAAGLLLIAGAALAWIGYHMVTRTLENSVEKVVDAMGRDIKRNIVDGIRRPALSFLAAFTQGPVPLVRTPEERIAFLPLIQEVMSSNSVFNGIVVSYDNGDIFMAKLLATEEERLFFDAPPETTLLVVENQGAGPGRSSRYFFYDSQSKLLYSREDNGGMYYLEHERFWHQKAMQSQGPVETGPLVTLSSQSATMMVAQKSRDGRAVIALGIRLDHLTSLLANERLTPGSRIALFQADGTLIARARGLLSLDDGQLTLGDLDDLPPVIRLGVEKYRQGLRTTNMRMEDGHESTGLWVNVDGRDWLLVLEELDDNPAQPGDFLVLAIPSDEMLGEARRFLRYTLLVMAGLLLLVVPVVWLAARHVSAPLRFMAERTRNPFKMTGPEGAKTPLSLVPEINGLMRNVDFMRENQRKILSIISLIGGDRDFETLAGRVLKEITAITGADGGLLMIGDESQNIFEKGWFCWDDGPAQKFVFYHDERVPWTSYALYRAVDDGRTVADHVTRDDPRAGLTAIAPGFAGHPDVERLNVVALPLRDRMGEPLGGLGLMRRENGRQAGFSADETAFIETIVAAAAVALETQALIKSQYDLRDALIRILAGAIDTKSPYTGGHCARVPVIFQMLLEAAHDAADGPLRDFHLDEGGREEARLAAWLHDCGKVTTPEYVMDKATKLETLYDRIHEIRTRFEVLKRDAEVAALKAQLNGADPEGERRKLAQTLAELDDDFVFVAACNIGGEYMDDAALARLAVIGDRPWVRTLDKRLGVSRDELARMEQAGVRSAPAVEMLLHDGPEHIIPRGPKDRLPEDNPWGFQLEEPPALYNRGELYNLGVRRGTLTAEERYKINDHITRTIMMLEKLPLPKHLRRAPEIAGAHHETMDGRGYPRRLKREDMSWEARMMAIADIFEALTAWDRPYKTSKTLREALEIMRGFETNRHIDPHLFELFLAADIPRRYAAEYLKPEQNDL